MHPNLILSNCQKELSDTSRWIKVEPADVVSECVGFNIENASSSSSSLSSSSSSTVKSKCHYSLSNSICNDHKNNDISDFDNYFNGDLLGGVTEKVSEDNLATTGKVRRPSQAISMQEIMDVHQALKSGVDIVIGDDPWVRFFFLEKRKRKGTNNQLK